MAHSEEIRDTAEAVQSMALRDFNPETQPVLYRAYEFLSDYADIVAASAILEAAGLWTPEEGTP